MLFNKFQMYQENPYISLDEYNTIKDNQEHFENYSEFMQ